VPGAGNPQAFNRYSYGWNKPVKYSDPSGHCAGVLSWIRGLATYDTTCDNLGLANDIAHDSRANVVEKALAVGYIGVEVTAHAAALVGTAGVVCGLTPACAAAVEPALGIGATTAAAASAAAANSETKQAVVDTASSLLEKVSRIDITNAKVDYLLRLDAGKAKGFDILGFTLNNADKLRETLGSIGQRVDLTSGEVTEFGIKFRQVEDIIGPNGAEGRLTTVWQIDEGSDVLRFITAIPEPFN